MANFRLQTKQSFFSPDKKILKFTTEILQEDLILQGQYIVQFVRAKNCGRLQFGLARKASVKKNKTK